MTGPSASWDPITERRSLRLLVPPAVRDAPTDIDGAPRLLDLLLDAMDGQWDLLEDAVDRLYDDLFIESCAPWVVPYLSELVGLAGDASRREVAYAVALGRRKGTPGALEDLSEVVTGWKGRLVEGWQVTAWSQRPGHPPPERVSVLDMHWSTTARVGTAFESNRRSADFRRWNTRAATLLVWPWEEQALLRVEAAEVDASIEPGVYRLHPLGGDAPLHLRPTPLDLRSDADDPSSIDLAIPSLGVPRAADELGAPVRASWDVIEALAGPGDLDAGTHWRMATTHRLATDATLVPLVQLHIGSTPVAWSKLRFGAVPPNGPALAPGPDEAVIDPSRATVALGSGLYADLEGSPLRATWYRPSAGLLGALGNTAQIDPTAKVVVRVEPHSGYTGPGFARNLGEAVDHAVAAWQLLAPDVQSDTDRLDVEIRITHSDRVMVGTALTFPVTVGTIPRWRIVASAGTTPTIATDLRLNLPGACVELAGCYVTGDIVVGESLAGLTLRHVTMDPVAGSVLRVDPSGWTAEVSVERSLIGGIRADVGAFAIRVVDSVVDGRGIAYRACGDPTRSIATDAIAMGPSSPSLGGTVATGAELWTRGATFLGSVAVDALDAQDSVFADGVQALRRQDGCVRYSFVGTDLVAAQTDLPATFRCGPFPPPTFQTTAFEANGYGALRLADGHPLLSAASDGGEVGAYHHLDRSGRLARLRRRAAEFVSLDVRSGVELARWED